MKIKNNRIENWVIFPRKIREDLINGLISKAEFFVLCYLRSGYNPYGKTHTSLENINSDVFGNEVSKSYINKIMLSLKSKRYLHYDNRQGRRGSFEVRFGDCITPDGAVLTLNKYFGQKLVENSSTDVTDDKEEVRGEGDLNQEQVNQKLKEIRKSIKGLSDEKKVDSVRGSYNDKDNEKDIN